MAETSGGLSAGGKSPAEGAGATNISYLPLVNPTNGGTVVSVDLQGPLRYVAQGEAQRGSACSWFKSTSEAMAASHQGAPNQAGP